MVFSVVGACVVGNLVGTGALVDGTGVGALVGGGEGERVTVGALVLPRDLAELG